MNFFPRKSTLKKYLLTTVLLGTALALSSSYYKTEEGRGGVLKQYNMVLVKGGSFRMGCTAHKYLCDEDDEFPVKNREVKDFYIMKYEFTQAEWQEITGENPSGYAGCLACPVENVSWIEVQAFIKKLNKKTAAEFRLPTEAEWEYAARGGRKSKGYKYAGSNDRQEVAWHGRSAGDKTHEVGLKKRNELGLYDMSGNVFEWCEDLYTENYTKEALTRAENQTVRYKRRVQRGGSFYPLLPKALSVSARNYDSSNQQSNEVGFRLVITKK